MTSPETPSPAPQGSAVIVDGSWKAIMRYASLLTVFLAALGGLFTWFDYRFANGLDGVERRLTAQIVVVKTDLTNRMDEVKADLTNRIDGVENHLSDRIDQVETGLNARIDRVEQRLSDRIDRVETELGSRIDRVETKLGSRIDGVEMELGSRIDGVEMELGNRIDGVKADLAASEAKREAADARQSTAMERLADGIAENRNNHRELVGFVRAHYPGAPQPATAEPEATPAQ